MNNACPVCGAIRYNVAANLDPSGKEIRFCRVCDTKYVVDFEEINEEPVVEKNTASFTESSDS